MTTTLTPDSDNATGADALEGLIHDASTGVPLSGDDDGIRVIIDGVPDGMSGAPLSSRVRTPRPSIAPATKTRRHTAKKKAELQTEVDDLQKKVTALESRGNEDALKRLAGSLELFAKIGFGLAADFRGDHWKQTPGALHDFGESGAFALAPYAVELNEQAPWLAFALCCLGMVSKPLSVEFAKRKETKETAQLSLLGSSQIKSHG